MKQQTFLGTILWDKMSNKSLYCYYITFNSIKQYIFAKKIKKEEIWNIEGKVHYISCVKRQENLK